MYHSVHSLSRSRIVGPEIVKIKVCFLLGGNMVHTLFTVHADSWILGPGTLKINLCLHTCLIYSKERETIYVEFRIVCPEQLCTTLVN